MRGTLAEGDSLWVTPVPAAALQPGDVVAFRSGKNVLAHRIVGRNGDRYLTQGDGNWRRDSAGVAPDQLLGKVAARERKGRRRAIAGGARGRRRAVRLHILAFMRWLLLAALSPFYRLLRASRIGRLVWRPQVTAAHFLGPAGSVTKYIHQGRTVACWLPQEQRWTCRKPYDLVLGRPSR